MRRGAGACARSGAGDAAIVRVLAPGGFVHLVTPFCHPFHEYPKDYRRFTLDGLKQLAGGLEAGRGRLAHRSHGHHAGVHAGVREAAAALALVARLVHGLGWVLSPLRYLDLSLLGTPHAGQIGNHCYLWLRRPG